MVNLVRVQVRDTRSSGELLEFLNRADGDDLPWHAV